MTRKLHDCRDWPGSCTLVIAGSEDEVVAAQALHVVDVHGQEDSQDLRQQIRTALKDAPEGM